MGNQAVKSGRQTKEGKDIWVAPPPTPPTVTAQAGATRRQTFGSGGQKLSDTQRVAITSGGETKFVTPERALSQSAPGTLKYKEAEQKLEARQEIEQTIRGRTEEPKKETFKERVEGGGGTGAFVGVGSGIKVSKQVKEKPSSTVYDPLNPYVAAGQKAQEQKERRANLYQEGITLRKDIKEFERSTFTEEATIKLKQRIGAYNLLVGQQRKESKGIEQEAQKIQSQFYTPVISFESTGNVSEKPIVSYVPKTGIPLLTGIKRRKAEKGLAAEQKAFEQKWYPLDTKVSVSKVTTVSMPMLDVKDAASIINQGVSYSNIQEARGIVARQDIGVVQGTTTVPGIKTMTDTAIIENLRSNIGTFDIKESTKLQGQIALSALSISGIAAGTNILTQALPKIAKVITSKPVAYGLLGLYAAGEGYKGYQGVKDIQAGYTEQGQNVLLGIGARGLGFGGGLSSVKGFSSQVKFTTQASTSSRLRLSSKEFLTTTNVRAKATVGSKVFGQKVFGVSSKGREYSILVNDKVLDVGAVKFTINQPGTKNILTGGQTYYGISKTQGDLTGGVIGYNTNIQLTQKITRKTGINNEFIKLYHGTSKGNVKKILKEGIVTQSDRGTAEVFGSDYSKKIWLATEISNANLYAGLKGKVLEVTIPKSYLTERLSGGDVFTTTSNIKPENIKVVKFSKTKSIMEVTGFRKLDNIVTKKILIKEPKDIISLSGKSVYKSEPFVTGDFPRYKTVLSTEQTFKGFKTTSLGAGITKKVAEVNNVEFFQSISKNIYGDNIAKDYFKSLELIPKFIKAGRKGNIKFSDVTGTTTTTGRQTTTTKTVSKVVRPSVSGQVLTQSLKQSLGQISSFKTLIIKTPINKQIKSMQFKNIQLNKLSVSKTRYIKPSLYSGGMTIAENKLINLNRQFTAKGIKGLQGLDVAQDIGRITDVDITNIQTTIQKQTTRDYIGDPIITSPLVSPPTPILFGGLAFPMLVLGGGKGFAFGKKQKGTFAYTPDFQAAVQNQFGKAPRKRRFSGQERRYKVRGKKFVSKLPKLKGKNNLFINIKEAFKL